MSHTKWASDSRWPTHRRAKNVLHSMKVELQDVEEREKAVFSKARPARAPSL